MAAALYLAQLKKEQEEQAKKKEEYINSIKSKIECNEAVLKELQEANDNVSDDMKVLASKYLKLITEKVKLKYKIYNCESSIDSLKRKFFKE